MLSLIPTLPPLTPSPSPKVTHSLSYTEKLFLDSTASVHALNSITIQNDIRLTAALHAAISKSGIHVNPFVGNALLHAYTRCGFPDYAAKLFDRMPERDVVSWTSLISGYCRNGEACSAMAVFLDMISEESAPEPNEFTLAAVLQACALRRDDKMARMVHCYLVTTGLFEDAFICNSLLDSYFKSGFLGEAEKLLHRLECRDVVSWSAAISGCVLHGNHSRALQLFVYMLEDGVAPNAWTMLSMIQGCSLMNEPSFFGWVHAWVIKLGLDSDPFVVNSLVEMYSKNGLVHGSIKVLFRLCSQNDFDPDVMGTIVQGCTLSGSLELARAIHGFLIKQDFSSSTIVENSLMDMYAKHEKVEQARIIFSRMDNRDIVSWNTMISCCVKNECVTEALLYLKGLHDCGGELVPDIVTMLSSIQGCSEIASLQHGQMLHGYAVRSGFNCDIFLSNALIDMYSKSGRIDLAEQVFGEMDVKDIGSWNSMIAAYGIHGSGSSALRVFTELKELGGQSRHQPNAITFNNVISACGHSGMAMEGYECFKSMKRDYGIEPSMEHYTSMVDLLGRCGRIREACDFIEQMPIEAGADVWGSLLGACGIYGDVDVAERAADKLFVLEPNETAWRVALANVYAKAGRWGDCAEVRAEMKRKGSKKEAGWSSVELNGGERVWFMAGDTRHSETNKIYGVWNAITKHIVDVK